MVHDTAENAVELPDAEDRDEAIKGKRPSDDQDHVCSHDEKLDESLEDSMDASDPPSQTHPDDHGDPAPSSGFKE